MISEDTIQSIANRVNQTGPSEDIVLALRGEYSPIHFTYCMDDDIGEVKPVHEESGFCLYLVDGREHCLCFTTDTGVATGLVIAEKETSA